MSISKNEVASKISAQIDVNYDSLEHFVNKELIWPELRYIRDEIITCLMTGCHQASITLTNHWLERILKTVLLYKISDGKKVNFDELTDNYSASIESFGDKDLEQIVNKCRNLGVLDKSTAKEIKLRKERYRDPYSHSDPTTIFNITDINGNTNPITAPMGIYPTEDNAKMKVGIVNVKDNPSLWGVTQKHLAENDALEYFKWADSLLEQLSHKVEQLPKK